MMLAKQQLVMFIHDAYLGVAYAWEIFIVTIDVVRFVTSEIIAIHAHDHWI